MLQKMFIVLLLLIMTASCSRTKRVSLSNKKCEIQPTHINLHPNEYRQELHYYQFAVKLDKCVRNCNVLINYVFQIKQKI